MDVLKSYVITILKNKLSVESAERCIKSGKRFGVNIEKWPAITPEDNPVALSEVLGINPDNFVEKYSRQENCLSAFLSHFSLWQECLRTNSTIAIFEHDAILLDAIPNFRVRGCVNIGSPSYGKFKTPMHIGVGPLTSKPYFPGAHAYVLSPEGAKILTEQAKKKARPTDLFLNIETFPWLQEHYPFIAMAQDSFTTIQNETGCLAKHNYDSNYRIINA